MPAEFGTRLSQTSTTVFYLKPDAYLFAPGSRVAARVLFRALLLVAVGASGFADDPDQDGDGDDRDDYENE